MNDPYKVLNVSPTASDDEVKRAYRELARKYHPDNYHDNPLADLAQEKMKEINEAYETVQRQRRAASGAQSYRGYQSGYQGYQGTQSGYAGSDPTLRQARAAVASGDISQAERLLNAAPEHNAEWNFLMGVVCMRRGWLDEAQTYINTAVQMDPQNAEYRQAQTAMNGEGYRPAGYGGFGTLANNDLCMRLCTASLCMSALGTGGCWVLPCFC